MTWLANLIISGMLSGLQQSMVIIGHALLANSWIFVIVGVILTFLIAGKLRDRVTR